MLSINKSNLEIALVIGYSYYKENDMRKILSLFIVLSIVSVAAFASDNFSSVSSLISLGLDKNASRIAAIAPDLSSAEKTMLYDSNKVNAGLPFAVNFFVGLGIGSYIQGDTAGGTIALVGELGSFALFGTGFLITAANSGDSMGNPGNENLMKVGGCVALAGVISYVGFRIFEWIRPFTYASNYNKKLSAALNGVPSVAVVPTIDENNEFGMAMVASIKF